MIKRDGALVSLWQHNIPDYVSKNTATEDAVYDVLIVGGGITGITTALLLQKSGKKCVLAEAKNICFGTSGGTTAHLNTLVDTPYNRIISDFGEDNARLIAQVTRNAIELVEKHVHEYKIDCEFKKLPAYLYSQDDKQTKELDKIYEACKKINLDVVYSDTNGVPIPFQKSMRIEQQAQIHPVKYLYALAEQFENMGGVLLQNCRVGDIDKGDVIAAETNVGTLRARNLIYATHIPPGVNILHFNCAPYRSYVLGVKLKGEYPDVLSYDMHEPYNYYRTHEVNGEKYLVAGGKDHKTAHEENTEKPFMLMEADVRKYFDVDEIAFRWSAQFFEPSDGIPYIGHLPGNPDNMYVATGFSGNGITYGTVSAIVLCQLLTLGESKYQKLFNPGRIKPFAGFSNFVKESADVVGILIGRPFKTKDLESLSELAPGEAKVVDYEKKKIAMYKDESGKIHAVNPLCTHVKCIVSWNIAEKRWDCPCLGSRFTMEGEVLTGPARKDLEKISIQEEATIDNPNRRELI